MRARRVAAIALPVLTACLMLAGPNTTDPAAGQSSASRAPTEDTQRSDEPSDPLKFADINGDGKISRAEWSKFKQTFSRLDANRDGSLELAELEKMAEAATAAASGSASLSGGDGKSSAKSGPTLWRGRIEGRGQIELLVNGNQVVGREIGAGGPGGPAGMGGSSLGGGTITMTGDGKSGNMDAVYTQGEHAGEVCLGIYKLDGDKLTWCVNNRGGRPQSFFGGGGNWLLTLTRLPNETSSTSTQ